GDPAPSRAIAVALSESPAGERTVVKMDVHPGGPDRPVRPLHHRCGQKATVLADRVDEDLCRFTRQDGVRIEDDKGVRTTADREVGAAVDASAESEILVQQHSAPSAHPGE